MAKLWLRQNEEMKFVSLKHLAPLVGVDKPISYDLFSQYSLSRKYELIKDAIEALPQDEQPAVVTMAPWSPNADSLKNHIGDPNSNPVEYGNAGIVREIFQMHVRAFDNDPAMNSKIREINKRYLSIEDVELIPYSFIHECVFVLMERSDGRGGDLPLPHTSPDSWRATLQQISQLSAAIARSKELAKK